MFDWIINKPLYVGYHTGQMPVSGLMVFIFDVVFLYPLKTSKNLCFFEKHSLQNAPS